MNIVYICSEYPPEPHGGIGTSTKDLAEYMVSIGWNVTVLGLYNVSKLEIENNYGVEVIKVPRENGFFGAFVSRFRLFKVYKNRFKSIDHILEVPDWQGLNAYWPKFKKAKLVYRIHGSLTLLNDIQNKPVNGVVRDFEKKSIDSADFIVGPSDFSCSATLALFKVTKEYEVIYNLIKVSPFEINHTPKREQILFVGTLTRIKGVDTVFRTYNRLKKEGVSISLIIAGKDGVWENGMKSSEYLLNLVDKEFQKDVIFTGHINRDELIQLYAESKLALLPSLIETFGYTAVEAMYYGCPTIFTSKGSGPEIIDDRKNGLLVDPYDEDEIFNVVQNLLLNYNNSIDLIKGGRDKVMSTFNYSSVMALNNAFYKKVINNE